MTVEELFKELQANANSAAAAFATKLGAPTPKLPFLGVRIPVLRKLVRRIVNDEPAECFIARLPRRYADEYMLEALLINEIKDRDALIGALSDFLPRVDTWASCDALSPALFRKNRAFCLQLIPTWLASQHTYTQRFGVVMLKTHFASEAHSPTHLAWVAALPHSREVDMAVAWYLAETLILHSEEVLKALAGSSFSPSVRLLAIQKAIESRRIPAESKERLRALRAEIRRR